VLDDTALEGNEAAAKKRRKTPHTRRGVANPTECNYSAHGDR
jgi:hypothetical protein